ncbi:MAG: thioredoxin domain-containing protein, partial [Chloroflexota bacterium]
PDPKWFVHAKKLAEEMITNFTDDAGGFYDTGKNHEELIIRPKDLQDNATPSGNSLAANALLIMASYTGNGEWVDLAVDMLTKLKEIIKKHPSSFGNWLCAMDYAVSNVQEIAIIGEPDLQETQELINELWSKLRINSISAISSLPIAKNAPALLDQRELVDGKPSAYVCEHFVCKTPVTTAKELRQLLL